MIFDSHGFQIVDGAHLPAGETFKDPSSTTGFFTDVESYKVMRWARVPSPPWVPRRRVVLLDRQQGPWGPRDGRRYVVAVHYAWSCRARGGVAFRDLERAEHEFDDRIEAIRRVDAERAAERARLASKPDLDSPHEARVRAALAAEGLRFAADDEPGARSLRVPVAPGLPVEVRAVRVRPGIGPRSWWIRDTEPYAG